MPSVKCSNCGGEAECFSREVGEGCHEVFTLVCEECGAVTEKTIKGVIRCDPETHSYPAVCPFCGEKSLSHGLTPKRYRTV